MTVRERARIPGVSIVSGPEGALQMARYVRDVAAVLAGAVDAELTEMNARVEALEASARGVRNVGPGWVSKVRAAEIVGRSKASILRYVESGLIPERDPETGETVWQIVRGRRLYSEAWLQRHHGLRRGG